MIVAQEVEGPVHQQHAALGPQGVAPLEGLALRGVEREHEVAEDSGGQSGSGRFRCLLFSCLVAVVDFVVVVVVVVIFVVILTCLLKLR